MTHPQKWRRLAMFLTGIMSLGLLTGLTFQGKAIIDTNLLSLLPHGERPEAVENAVDLISKRSERSHVMLVSAPDLTRAKTAADQVAHDLTATGLYARIDARVDTQRYLSMGRFYFPYRYRLLPTDLIQQIENGNTENLVEATIRRLYSPVAGSAGNLEHDPFFMLEHFLTAKAFGNRSSLHLEDGYLTARARDGEYHVLVTADLKASPFDITAQDRLVAAKSALDTDLAQAGANILYAGVVEHAIAGTRTGQAEVALVGGVSLVGVLFLLLIMFRSLLPIAASLATIFIGIATGLCTCLIVFGQVHLITLVAGGSLIGISIDYALHYFVALSGQAGDKRSDQALRHILPGILLGLGTSLIGFAALFLAPFPGLRQLAVFSGAGLIAAFLSVICLYPIIAHGRCPALPAGMIGATRRWLDVWQGHSLKYHCLWVASLGALGYCLAFFTLTSQDDIRLLQTPDTQVIAAENAIKSVTGQNIATQFYLISGPSPQAVLEAEEKVTGMLGTADYRDAVDAFMALSHYVPSLARQRSSLTAAQNLAQGPGAAIARLTAEVGFSNDLVTAFSADVAQSAEAPLTLENWLNSGMAPEIARLWLGQTGSTQSDPQYHSVILLNGVKDVALLAQLASRISGATWVDNVADISHIFGRYRERAQWLLMAAYVTIATLLSLRYGIVNCLVVMIPPLAAAGITVAGLGLLGEPYNLFNIVGLILVLGIGIDYTLFFREAATDQTGAGLAITLAAISTMLAFGLLAFSSLPALHSFGLTVLIGIAAALLFAPLARRLSSHANQGTSEKI